VFLFPGDPEEPVKSSQPEDETNPMSPRIIHLPGPKANRWRKREHNREKEEKDDGRYHQIATDITSGLNLFEGD